MTVVLVFAFAQYGELFIASLAVWIGVLQLRGAGSAQFRLIRISAGRLHGGDHWYPGGAEP